MCFCLAKSSGPERKRGAKPFVPFWISERHMTPCSGMVCGTCWGVLACRAKCGECCDAVVESCVLVGQDRTEWFSIEAGLRQGCILSPILFAIFIDGLAREIKAAKTVPTIEKLRINI